MNHSEFEPLKMEPTEPVLEPMDPRLEQALMEIRAGKVDDAVVEAAAARVWARVAAEPLARRQGARAEEECSGDPINGESSLTGESGTHSHIRGCADFQALIPDYRSGKLPEARAALLQDHLHHCVACRKVYEGRVIAMPAAAPAGRRPAQTVKWAAAAVVVLTAGAAVWFTFGPFGTGPGRATVQAVSGSLFVLGPDGTLHPLAPGQALPEGAEVRTAKDSTAMLQLRDGSLIELRERSAVLAEADAADLTLRLNRGNVIVQAAKRRKGHLYVATADCRVAVTGTVFSVAAGVKGSRVSVVEGEVHVAQESQEHILHPGDQLSTSASIQPEPLREEIGWSRNRDRLIEQLNKARIEIQQVQFPGQRYQSRLAGRLPADTAFYASLPNLGDYLGQTQDVFLKNLAESPELRAWWAGRDARIERVIGKLREGGAYLGDEIAVVGLAGASGIQGPAFLAETKREGFPEFLKQAVPGAAVMVRPGVVVFGPDAAAVETLAASLDSTSAAFQATPFYARIADAFHQGAGMLFCADLSRLPQAAPAGVRYFIAGERQVDQQTEVRATLGFAGERTGIAAWLASPAPMGSLDYVTPEATFVAAFVVRDPAAIVDQVAGVGKMVDAAASPAAAIRDQLVASLGGEFSVSFDGPLFPPAWKLVAEVYDPRRVHAALRQVVDTYNEQAARNGTKPLRTAEETVNGRTYYMIAAADPNPLTEAHYTFADGYLLAAPTRDLLAKAIETKLAGTSITHAAKFMAMEPRDRFADYSALVYENFGRTLAPLAGLLGGFMGAAGGHGRGNFQLDQLGNMKPLLLAAYAAPNQITFAAKGDALPSAEAGFASLLSGNLAGMVGGALPIGQLHGARRR
jgi:ferric-dicitrate binding protein FerR (iron transport regulator)